MPLLRGGLVSTVAELGRSIDQLELEHHEVPAAGVGEHRLAQSHNPLLDTGNGALDQDEVVLDLTVADEATKTADLLATAHSAFGGWKLTE